MKNALRFALSVLLAVVLVALLFRWSGTTVAQVTDALRGLDPRVHVLALGIQAVIYPLRALRLRALLPDDAPSVSRLTGLSAAHILAANVLPAKLGEAALVIYLRRAGVAAANGLAALLLSRLFDFAAVTGGLALACFAMASAGTHPELEWLVPTGAFLLVPAAVCAWTSLNGERLVALAGRILGALGLARTALGTRILEFSSRAGAALGAVPRGRLAFAAACTLPIWLLVFAFYGVLARGFGMEDLSFPIAVFGSGLAIVATLLPLHGFAGFGVQDAGWVAGFVALGVEPELATSSGLAAHVVYLVNIAVLGALGHVAMATWVRRARGSAA